MCTTGTSDQILSRCWPKTYCLTSLLAEYLNPAQRGHVVDPLRATKDIYGTFVDNLRKHPRTALCLGLGIAAYSVAHGGTALAAGLLARALAANPAGSELREGLEFGQMLGRLDPGDVVFLGLIATGVKALASVLITFMEIRTAAIVGNAARSGAISALLQHGRRVSSPLTLAALASRCRELELAVVHGVVRGGRAAAQLVPLGLALILMSPRLALIGTVALLPFTLLLARLRRHWRSNMARAQSLHDELTVGVDDLVANLDLWRSYSAGRQAERAIVRAASAANRASAVAGASRAALSGFNEVLAVLALLACVMLAPRLGIEHFDGTLLGFAAVFFMTYRPLRDLGDARGFLLQGSVALQTIRSLGREPTAENAAEGPRPTLPATLDPTELAPAELQLVDFGPERLSTRTSLRAAPGEIVALVGPTGSGKTSLLKALLGLEPAVGDLRFGSRDLTRAALGPPARPFAWVPQDAPLVGDTLLANVALFSDEARARDALAMIGAEPLIGHLEGQQLGPGGRALSGGERRLVSLARALASGLPVLLLDEPTEGLDPAAQARVLGALAELRQQRTLLIVTHRAEVAALADRVVDFEGGALPQVRGHKAEVA